jgi:TPR repeat protein
VKKLLLALVTALLLSVGAAQAGQSEDAANTSPSAASPGTVPVPPDIDSQIRKWGDLEDRCRGSTDPESEATHTACRELDNIVSQLRSKGWCFGTDDQSEAERTWQQCRSDPFADAAAAYQRGDYAAWLQILRPMAARGDARAQGTLGAAYDYGDGVTQDYGEAVKWYRLAAAQGLAPAQTGLGMAYANGHGVTQNYAEAANWFRLAAAQGEPHAQNNLGTAYSNGQGVARNYAEAVRWYRLAAAQGEPTAQTGLGVAYASGQGVTQNYAEAVKWFRLAAAQGHAYAQLDLGLMCLNGQGIRQNYAEAVKWFRLAAAQGVANAQFNLGVAYRDGQGVIQDYVRAHMWFNLSVESSYASGLDSRSFVAGRDSIAERMTPQQIAEAQAMARECQQRNFKGCD